MKAPKKSGIVHLVGAGPGDPGLLTVNGRSLLERADVVVYDYLANSRLLSYCPQAELIYVGKKAADHTMTQDEINQLLVDQARTGKRVVRLKGGDPFVFGRGGEECQTLHDAGIPFEVVPGITSAIGGTCYAGIPVTHRDFNSSFTIVTGHERDEQPSDIDWSVIARLPCVAFYMGVKALGRICQNLIDHGMKPDTPAATIQWGTTPRQRSVCGTIADLPQRVDDAGISSPAITIVGRVVALRPIMTWFESRPLFGQTIVVTRTRQQASDLSTRLEELGANVIEAPTIDLVEPRDWKEVDDALNHAASFDWVIFTSANGVTFARDRLRQLKRDARVFGRAKLAAIGDATAQAIAEQLCLHVDLCPRRFVAEALADELVLAQQVAARRFLLLRADIARPILREKLVGGGAAEVRDVAIYQTVKSKSLPPTVVEGLSRREIDWITFTSSSTARNFIDLLGGDYRIQLQNVKLASIGPITTQTLADLKLKPAVQAEPFNIDGLVEAMVSIADGR